MALALGAGGARGYAHIGAIRELQRRGMEIAEVSGTSMGALIGGLAAHGTLDEYEEWALGLKRSDVFRLMDPSWSGPGAISADKVLEKVNELIGEVTIEQLPIHFTAVATDLAARREVWFQSGPLHAAIRASIAIPGIITPVLINGRLLVDGGLLNPVPIEPLARAAADLTIAISLAGPRAAREPESPSTESTDPQRFEVWRAPARLLLIPKRSGGIRSFSYSTSISILHLRGDFGPLRNLCCRRPYRFGLFRKITIVIVRIGGTRCV